MICSDRHVPKSKLGQFKVSGGEFGPNQIAQVVRAPEQCFKSCEVEQHANAQIRQSLRYSYTKVWMQIKTQTKVKRPVAQLDSFISMDI